MFREAAQMADVFFNKKSGVCVCVCPRQRGRSLKEEQRYKAFNQRGSSVSVPQLCSHQPPPTR